MSILILPKPNRTLLGFLSLLVFSF